MSKRLNRARELVGSSTYELSDALDLLKSYKDSCGAKFDETVEVVFKLGVIPGRSDQVVRGAVAMPGGLGREVRICAFVGPEEEEEARKAGVELAGGESLIEDVKNGRVDLRFDVCLATPGIMPKLAVLGKILGPKGLMPNPKTGGVTSDIGEAVRSVRAGQVDYRSDKGGLVHAGIGKVTFTKDALMSNIKALCAALLSSKPSGIRGDYIRKMYMSTSQGVSIAVNPRGIVA